MRAAVLLVIVTVAACSFGATVATGAFVPQNDDWSFIRSALELHRTGQIRLQGWGQMFMLGQLVSAQPFLVVFGEHVASLKLYGVTMTAVWMWCSFVLARRCLGPRAVAVPVALALWPGLPLLASSFMTDLPAAAMALLSLVVGLHALDRQSRRWLAVTVLVGVFGFTIREQAVAGLGAVLVGVLLHPAASRRFRAETLVATASAAVVCVALETVRHGLAHADIPSFDVAVDMSRTWRSLLRVPFTLGLVLSPLCLWSLCLTATASHRGWPGRGRVAGWGVGLVSLAVLAADYLPHPPRVLLSNYATPVGGFRVAAVGYVPTLAEPWLWDVAQLTGAAAGLVLLGEVGARCTSGLATVLRTGRSADPAATMLSAYTALIAGSVLALSIVGQVQVDRYQVTMLPGLAVLLLASAPRRPPGTADPTVGRRAGRAAVVTAATALSALLVTLSVTNTITTNRRDRAVWETAQRLTQRGVPATHINAGLSWNGSHATTPLDRDHSDSRRYRGQQWMYLFPESTDCYVVAVSQLPQHDLIPLPTAVDPGTRGVHAYRNLRCRLPLP